MSSKILIINALHHRPHHSHLNLEEALALIKIVQPEQAFLTHISHNMGTRQATEALLPPNVALAFDGLRIEF